MTDMNKIYEMMEDVRADILPLNMDTDEAYDEALWAVDDAMGYVVSTIKRGYTYFNTEFREMMNDKINDNIKMEAMTAIMRGYIKKNNPSVNL